jgi:hypothetical protein
MKTEKEIEQLAENYYISDYSTEEEQSAAESGFIDGYTQCQDDMAKELEMHILVNEHDWSRNPQAQLKDFFNSLNKQDNEHI